MEKIFRVFVQIEQLIDDDFKRIIGLEETTRNITGIREVLADKYNAVFKFLDKLPEDKNAPKNPINQ